MNQKSNIIYLLDLLKRCYFRKLQIKLFENSYRRRLKRKRKLKRRDSKKLNESKLNDDLLKKLENMKKNLKKSKFYKSN